jgi:hypothetical protein
MASLPLFPAAARPMAVERYLPTMVGQRLSAMPRLAGVAPASRLEIRPAPEMVSSGVPDIDTLTGGFPRGCLAEMCGAASSGRTSVLLAALAAATRRQEACALVDVSDAFHPQSAAAAGINFENLLWIRCGVKSNSRQRSRNTETKEKSEGPVEQALRVTDLLLQSGGFGLVLIDLGDTPLQTARRIPLTSWFRFQRAVEGTSTVLLVVTQEPCARTCASVLLKVSGKKLSAISCQLSAKNPPAHAQLLNGLQIQGELLRSRLDRKPAGSVTAVFATKVRAG